MHCKIWQEMMKKISFQHPEKRGFNAKATVVSKSNEKKGEMTGKAPSLPYLQLSINTCICCVQSSGSS